MLAGPNVYFDTCTHDIGNVSWSKCLQCYSTFILIRCSYKNVHFLSTNHVSKLNISIQNGRLECLAF